MVVSKLDWTQPKSDVTDQLVYEVAKIIVSGIQNSGNGVWTANLTEIREANGQIDPEEYGTYLQAVGIACKRYGINWAKAGPNGRRYSIDPVDMAKFLAIEAVKTGKYDTKVTVTLTCPCCNTPTTYEVHLTPVVHQQP